MLKAMLIDDEQPTLDNLLFILKSFPEIQVILSTTDPSAAISALPSASPDVVFLDINIPLINGFELAEKINELCPKCLLIFVTAYEQYALEAFNAKAVGYLLKPVTTSKMRRAVDRILQLRSIESSPAQAEEPVMPVSDSSAAPVSGSNVIKIPVYHNNNIRLVDPKDALFFTVIAHDVFLVTPKGKFQVRNSLNYWEEKLKDQHYFRCHRGYLINLNQLSQVSPMFNSTYIVRMKGCEEEVIVSRNYSAQFRKLLNL